ncbi:ECs1072 family phage-associated protein [Klebsiella pneumoniae]|uniref:ECs1072 family phage-associated protein n=1 Tax=Klebsiella pneumoniae TaxID=573 RepID=UPI003B5BEFAD
MGQIFTLECILDEYRKHFSSDYYYLDNDKALHHLIFEMTKWKPEEIRRLSLNDCLFIIASQLKPSYMLEDAAAVLASLNLPTGHYPVEDFPQEDWDPRENSAFLQSYQ